MKLLFLGCGTSTGVPVIGCPCGVCASKDPRNHRTRSSLLIEIDGKNILIDASTDLRAQALGNGITRIDAVLFTHPHADHIHGIDDLRAFNMAQGAAIPIYANEHTISRIKAMFDYIFAENNGESWRPDLTPHVIEGPFSIFGTQIVPIDISHGKASILGFRFGDAAYVTDCSHMPAASLEKLMGIKVLIINALRHRPHPTHLNIEQALEISRRLKPERTFLTHLSHSLDYAVDGGKLPEGVELAYDGLTLEV